MGELDRAAYQLEENRNPDIGMHKIAWSAIGETLPVRSLYVTNCEDGTMADFAIKVGKTVSRQLKKESFFGHDPMLRGLVPPGAKLPAQLVLTLDKDDSRFDALDVGVGQSIRSVYPFYYEEGFSAYHHRDDDQIEFANFSNVAYGSWPSKEFPSVLPTRTIEVVDLGQAPKRSDGDCSTIFVGSDVPTVQKFHGERCVACAKENLRLIASVPGRPIPELKIWEDDYIFVLFRFCPDCKAINTHNECD